MFGRRELFILAGVVAIDSEVARVDSLEVALQQIEDAARNAVKEADQRLIDANVSPTDGHTAAMLDVRFSGDQNGALAAFESWKHGVVEVPAAGRVLRTLLRGKRLNLEWIDDDYQTELQARWDADEDKP
jgi:hypothetical protein